MVESIEIWEKPAADEIYMIAGWRQWADGGSVSSGLPEYLIERSQAKPIGRIRPDGFYLFQIPGTHGLVRPVVKFEQGYPPSLETQQNDFFYAGDEQRGLIYFLGDEPHLDIERYAEAFLQAARELRVKRIIGLGGVYGGLPYEKGRRRRRRTGRARGGASSKGTDGDIRRPGLGVALDRRAPLDSAG